jgi:heme-degrading monooxygenase HmoA
MPDFGKAAYVIVNTYARSEGATQLQAGLWDRYVPELQAIPGFVAVCTLETPDDGSEGASLSFWETREAAQQYLDSKAREELDDAGAAFRPGANRRIMRVLKST